MNHGLSIIVPTYNELFNISKLISEISNSSKNLNYPIEIIVVDDSSPDGTADFVDGLSLKSSIDISVIRRTGLRSLSASVVDGFESAKYSCLLVMDADLSHDPKRISELSGPILKGECDLSIASRYVDGGATPEWPLYRRLLSRFGTFPAKWISGVNDPLAGYFAIHKSALDNCVSRLKPLGFKILLEILGRSYGLKIKEVSLVFKDRSKGSSKLQARQKIEFILQLFSLIPIRVSQIFNNKKNQQHIMLDSQI